MPRTNSLLETWHCDLQSSPQIRCPKIIKLVKHLRKEQALQEINLIQIEVEETPKYAKK